MAKYRVWYTLDGEEDRFRILFGGLLGSLDFMTRLGEFFSVQQRTTPSGWETMD